MDMKLDEPAIPKWKEEQSPIYKILNHLEVSQTRRSDIEDAIENAIQNGALHSPKVYLLCANARLSIYKFDTAILICQVGLKFFPKDANLRGLLELTEYFAAVELDADDPVLNAFSVADAIKRDRVTFGEPVFVTDYVRKKPLLIEGCDLHWPVCFLYFQESGTPAHFISDPVSADTQVSLLCTKIFPKLVRPAQNSCTEQDVHLYYMTCASTPLGKKGVIQLLLDGTKGCEFDITGVEEDDWMPYGEEVDDYAGDSRTWVEVEEGKTVKEILQEKDLMVPRLPVLYATFTSNQVESVEKEKLESYFYWGNTPEFEVVI